jgi:DNA-binding NtrC family response regulator
MTPPTQTKILRVLQSGTFERVGGNQPIQADVRVIAATNKPLEAAVAAKQFREDLFYRLNVVRIHIPPLRDRRDDIPLLVNYFLKKISREQQQHPKSIATSVIKTLEKYHWPGNVRELENAIERSLVLASGNVLEAPDIRIDMAPKSRIGSTDGFLPEGMTLDSYEQSIIREALNRANGNKSQAARLLGLSRNALRYRLSKLGVEDEGE